MPRAAKRVTVVSVALLVCAFVPSTAWSARGDPCVVHAEVDGLVTGALVDYLADAIAAGEQECHAVLVRIDTPGGDLESTRKIAQMFLRARVPIITFVAPAGARAGSAGMFLVLASHVAVMAPGTNIGAAHPVTAGGKDPEEAGGEHMGRKIEEDTAAFARALAQRHGRNARWAESAVRRSRSATAREAEASGVVDLVAASERDLLARLHGRKVRVAGAAVRLATAGASLRPLEMTISQRVRSILANPNLAYLLLMLGILGLVMELYHPGLIIPGAVGAISLLLAAIGLGALPVNAGAVVLLLVAAGLLVAELYVTSFGLLTLAGVGLLILGSALLIDGTTPDFFVDAPLGVSWGAIIPLSLVVGGAMGLLAVYVIRTRRRPSPTGAEGLIGARARAVTDIDERTGVVSVHGERWTAVSEQPVSAGQAVEVTAIEGLRLRVAPITNEKRERDHERDRMAQWTGAGSDRTDRVSGGVHPHRQGI